MNQEMFKGNFGLVLPEKMPVGGKFEKFAHDPLAFHLHKNRNFVYKMEKHIE